MSSKRPYPHKVFYAARKRGLFAMPSGTGRNFKYEFWDKDTGKLVLIYYPDSGHWMAGQREGKAADYRDALIEAIDRAPSPST